MRPLADRRHFLWRPVGFATVSIALAMGAFLLRGPNAAAGLLLGVLGAGASVLGTWLLVRMMGRAAADNPLPPIEAFLSMTGFFFKWVVVVVSMWTAHRIGSPATGCFLGGMLLVYSRLIGQAFLSD